MTAERPTRRALPIVVGIAVALVVASAAGVGIGLAVGGGDDEQPPAAQPGRTESPEESSAPAPTPADSVTCPSNPDAVAGDARELEDALADARPGDVIALEPGRYLGNFVATVSGTADDPIMLCGPSTAVLDGGDWDDGYVFHLDGAQYWHLLGFTVTNGQKGVMADGTVGSVIEALTVSQIGDEAIHLRRFSTDNLVIGNTVDITGLRREKFGEGVYIGTAESNWCDISGCQPDTSDRNVVEGNTIRGTTAEAVDIKEGTTGGVVRGNTFDGSGMHEDGSDSWVDVKGNDWLIEGNVGRHSLLDGFQTHEILDGWGTRNVFRGNTAEVNGPGFGYSLTPVRDNVVLCDNTASGAGEGFSNVECSSG